MVTALTRFVPTVALAAFTLTGFAPTAYAQNFGEWGVPASIDPSRLLVNTTRNDGCPIETPDGQQLFFASDRGSSLDIWVASRESEAGDFTSVERLPYPVNVTAADTTDHRDFCPTPLPGNRLLFVSARANNCGGTGNNPDIYITRLHPVKGWLPPEPLSCDVNSGAEEWSPSLVEAEGKTLLYFSSTRGDRVQRIYVSELQSDGSWSQATEVVELNLPGAQNARPNVRKDGLEIVFDSTYGGVMPDIWTASRASVLEAWSGLHKIENVNSPGAETRATISRDGQRLYFGSTRANQSGDTGADIFVSTRSGPGNR